MYKLIFNLFLVGGLFSVDYQTEIQPIFTGNCGACHTSGSQAGLNLSSYENVMEGSNNGPVVLPFDHEASVLWQRVNAGTMPPNSTLSPSQVLLIADWIDEGALETAVMNSVEITNFAFTPNELAINVGEIVTWTSSAASSHSVIGDNGEWGSEPLINGDTFMHVFSEAGEFNYHCGFHGSMTGTILVGDLSNSSFTELPDVIILHPAYPNPFNPGTMISWFQPLSKNTRLDAFNLNGALVEVLLDNYVSAGFNQIQWQPENFNSGIYFLRIQSGNFLATQKLVYLK